jgi:hypothetical protein
MAVTITIKGDEQRANDIMVEIAESIDKQFLPVNVYPGNKFQIHECPDGVRDIVDEIAKVPSIPGTPPDTSLFLGDERRAWLKSHGGLQPAICAMVDRAMKRNP